MIAVRLDFAPAKLSRIDRQAVVVFLSLCPEPAYLLDQISDTIGFLVSVVCNAADPCRALGKKCNSRSGLDRIADIRHVDVDPVACATRNFYPSFPVGLLAKNDLRAHLFEYFYECYVPLEGVQT